MSKRLVLILTLAFVVGISLAYAEVQNVKVSGDILISALSRNQFDLDKSAGEKNQATNAIDDAESAFATQVRLRIDADLTDNVLTTLRLINERNWDQETVSTTDIDLDLAYVTLKEFLTSPLTLTVGRQEIKLGNALIIGNALVNYNYSGSTYLAGVPSDLSLRRAFDAVRATLNYDPLVVDLIYAKLNESATKVHDDVDLYGIYANYALNKKTTADAYIFNKIDSVTSTTTAKRDNIKTVGALLSVAPIENLKASLEGAYQLGTSQTAAQKHKRAWATQGMLDYNFAKVKYTPAIGASYTYLSGDGETGEKEGADTAWDPMYYDQSITKIAYAILPWTNMTVIGVKGSAKPMEDLALVLNYGFYRRDKLLPTTLTSYNRDTAAATYSYTMTDKKALGQELDLTGTYDYTEDVQFGLNFGYFIPGEAFSRNQRSDATQIIGSMKVTF